MECIYIGFNRMNGNQLVLKHATSRQEMEHDNVVPLYYCHMANELSQDMAHELMQVAHNEVSKITIKHKPVDSGYTMAAIAVLMMRAG